MGKSVLIIYYQLPIIKGSFPINTVPPKHNSTNIMELQRHEKLPFFLKAFPKEGWQIKANICFKLMLESLGSHNYD